MESTTPPPRGETGIPAEQGQLDDLLSALEESEQLTEEELNLRTQAQLEADVADQSGSNPSLVDPSFVAEVGEQADGGTDGTLEDLLAAALQGAPTSGADLRQNEDHIIRNVRAPHPLHPR